VLTGEAARAQAAARSAVNRMAKVALPIFRISASLQATILNF
jgi:hypothetical protein